METVRALDRQRGEQIERVKEYRKKVNRVKRKEARQRQREERPVQYWKVKQERARE